MTVKLSHHRSLANLQQLALLHTVSLGSKTSRASIWNLFISGFKQDTEEQ
jgi:hypothetical protein